MSEIRQCRDDELTTMLAIINAGAMAYKGAIPSDRWHDPYMSLDQLRAEIAAGVSFWGMDIDGELVGVMGIQPVRDVDLVRHAYVLPDWQRQGIGAELIKNLRRRTKRRILVGTWAAATWAIDFYRRNGYTLMPPQRTAELLRTYWTIPERQIETSVVLESPDVSVRS